MKFEQVPSSLPTEHEPPPIDPCVELSSSAEQESQIDTAAVTEILTHAGADKALLRLLKNPDAYQFTPGVAKLLKNFYSLKEYDQTVPEYRHLARFHHEGDVFMHVLKVLRAINTPEVLSLVREVYHLEDDVSDTATVEHFFVENGMTLGWAILLHDNGKRATWLGAYDENHQPLGHYQFHGHGEASAKEFQEELLAQLEFTSDQAQEITLLIKDHMLMHKIMRSVDQLTDDDKNKILSHPHKEKLLWLALLDSIGNYSRPSTESTVSGDALPRHLGYHAPAKQQRNAKIMAFQKARKMLEEASNFSS